MKFGACRKIGKEPQELPRRKTFEKLGRTVQGSALHRTESGGQKEFFINIKTMAFTASLHHHGAGCHDGDDAGGFILKQRRADVRACHAKTVCLPRSNEFILPRSW